MRSRTAKARRSLVCASGGLAALALLAASSAFSGCGDLDAKLVPATQGDGAADTSDDAPLDAGPTCPVPRPPEGVYTYSTGQSLPAIENLTISGTTTQIKVGPNFSGSVRYSADGYAFRLALSDQHNSQLRMSQGMSAVEIGGSTELVYGNISTTSCTPPVSWLPCMPTMAPLPIACTGGNSMIDGGYNIVGTHTLAGNDAVVVAGVSVPALHYVDHRTVQGTTQGTQDLDWWLRTSDGLPLRNIITTSVTSPSPIGPVTYSVNLDFTLQSTTPTPLPIDASVL